MDRLRQNTFIFMLMLILCRPSLAQINDNTEASTLTTYRKAIRLNNSNATPVNSYTVRIPVTYELGMQRDFSDLRFKQADGQTPLAAWLEKKVDGVNAVFWVALPSIAAQSRHVIYLYYGSTTGEPHATSMAAFLAADDFNRKALLPTRQFESRIFDGGSEQATWSRLTWQSPEPAGLPLPKGGEADSDTYTHHRLSSKNASLLFHFDDPVDVTRLKNDGLVETDINCVDNEQSCPQAEPQGKILSARRFDGNDGLAIPDSDQFTLGSSPFTIATWINFSKIKTTAILAHDEGSGESNRWFFLYDDTAKMLAFLLYNGSTLVPVHAAWVPTANTWYHLAVTRAGDTFTLYVNGQVIASKQSKATLSDPAAPLTIGTTANGAFLNGMLDELIFIKQTAWTHEEVFSAYTRGTMRFSFQVRTCVTPTCADAPFVGPDNTPSTVFSSGLGSTLDLSRLPARRYFSYRVIPDYETDRTPILNAVVVHQKNPSEKSFADQAPSDFANGSMIAMGYDVNANGLIALSKNDTRFYSRIFDAGTAVDWQKLSFSSVRPAQKALPNNQSIDTGYLDGIVDMRENSALFHLDEPSIPAGKRFYDASGQGIISAEWVTSTPASISKKTEGRFESGLALKQDDTLLLHGSETLGTGDFSLTFWVRINALNDTGFYLFGKRAACDPSGTDFQAYVQANGQMGISGDNRTPITSTHALTLGTWHHVVYTFTQTTGDASLYIDGYLSGQGELTTNAKPNDAPLILGGSGSCDRVYRLNGTLDEVALFSRALTDTDVFNHYARGANRIKFQVRSCDDPLCDGEVFTGPEDVASFYTENDRQDDTGISLATSTIPTNRYVQYRAIFESDIDSVFPELNSVTLESSGADLLDLDGSQSGFGGGTALNLRFDNTRFRLTRAEHTISWTPLQNTQATLQNGSLFLQAKTAQPPHASVGLLTTVPHEPFEAIVHLQSKSAGAAAGIWLSAPSGKGARVLVSPSPEHSAPDQHNRDCGRVLPGYVRVKQTRSDDLKTMRYQAAFSKDGATWTSCGSPFESSTPFTAMGPVLDATSVNDRVQIDFFALRAALPRDLEVLLDDNTTTVSQTEPALRASPDIPIIPVVPELTQTIIPQERTAVDLSLPTPVTNPTAQPLIPLVPSVLSHALPLSHPPLIPEQLKQPTQDNKQEDKQKNSTDSTPPQPSPAAPNALPIDIALESPNRPHALSALREVSYLISLRHKPTAPVTITLTPSAPLDLDTHTLVFDTDDWHLPQAIVVFLSSDKKMPHTSPAPEKNKDKNKNNRPSISIDIASDDPTYHARTVPPITPIVMNGAEARTVQADAGRDTRVFGNTTITLSGSHSTGEALTYTWDAGGCGSFDDRHAESPVFTAPEAPCRGMMVRDDTPSFDIPITLTATAPSGETSRDTLTITVIRQTLHPEPSPTLQVGRLKSGIVIHETQTADKRRMLVLSSGTTIGISPSPDTLVRVAISKEGHLILAYPEADEQTGRVLVSRTPLDLFPKKMITPLDQDAALFTELSLYGATGTRFGDFIATGHFISDNTTDDILVSGENGYSLYRLDGTLTAQFTQKGKPGRIVLNDIDGNGIDDMLIIPPIDTTASDWHGDIPFTLGDASEPVYKIVLILGRSRRELAQHNNTLAIDTKQTEDPTVFSIRATIPFNRVETADVNRDGFLDIIASYADASIGIYYGPVLDRSLETPDLLITSDGNTNGFGSALQVVDLDCDQQNDLVIGDPSALGGYGWVGAILGPLPLVGTLNANDTGLMTLAIGNREYLGVGAAMYPNQEASEKTNEATNRIATCGALSIQTTDGRALTLAQTSPSIQPPSLQTRPETQPPSTPQAKPRSRLMGGCALQSFWQ